MGLRNTKRKNQTQEVLELINFLEQEMRFLEKELVENPSADVLVNELHQRRKERRGIFENWGL